MTTINFDGFAPLTKGEVDEFGLVPYDYDGLACYVQGTVCVFRRGNLWHAVGETPEGDEVDTIWADEGTTDLADMLDLVREANGE